MAEGPAERTLQKLEQEITCPICHGHFRDPKILPCLHYYCQDCVQAMADRAGPNRPFSCPECRSDTRLPQNDASQLATAFVINRLKDLHSLMETADRKVEAVCQQCSGGKSEGFCRHCAEFICGKCVKCHERMKAFAGHEVLTLDELKEGGAKKMVAKPPPRMCQKHDEQKKIYCFDCDCLICRDCLLDEHNGHKYGFIKQAAPQYREALVQQMAPLNATHKRYSDATVRAKAMISVIEIQNTKNIVSINQWIEEWMEIIQRYGRNLIDDLSGTAQKKIEYLLAQIKRLESDSAVVQSLGEFCEQNLEIATDEEFVELHQQMLSLLEDECRKHKDTNLELAEVSDVGVELPSNQNLEELCRNEAKMVVLDADPASCTVDLESAEVNKSSHLTVCARYRNGAPCKKPQVVEGELNSLVDGSLVHLKGTLKNQGAVKPPGGMFAPSDAQKAMEGRGLALGGSGAGFGGQLKMGGGPSTGRLMTGGAALGQSPLVLQSSSQNPMFPSQPGGPVSQNLFGGLGVGGANSSSQPAAPFNFHAGSSVAKETTTGGQSGAEGVKLSFRGTPAAPFQFGGPGSSSGSGLSSGATMGNAPLFQFGQNPNPTLSNQTQQSPLTNQMPAANTMFQEGSMEEGNSPPTQQSQQQQQQQAFSFNPGQKSFNFSPSVPPGGGQGGMAMFSAGASSNATSNSRIIRRARRRK